METIVKNEQRRRLLLGAAAGLVLGGAVGSGEAAARTASDIDRSAANALRDLYRQYPESRRTAEEAYGVLVLPDIVKAGLIVGASYGEGALIRRGRTHSYWSFTAGSIGLQAGGQRTRMALFFMNKNALEKFIASDGVQMGVDAEITMIDGGGDLRLDTTSDRYDVLAYVFGRAGLMGGASYTGGKYRRLQR